MYALIVALAVKIDELRHWWLGNMNYGYSVVNDA
jgi:hypothetical protein